MVRIARTLVDLQDSGMGRSRGSWGCVNQILGRHSFEVKGETVNGNHEHR
jgi:hypothetical protein